ncbi:MAG: 6-phosphogluconolactonase [Chloroflexota bacterium]
MTAAPTPADRGEPEVLVLPDGEVASTVAARRIAAALTAAVDARGVAHWATTGGSTPGPIYRDLAREPLHDSVPWDRVHLWWGDDRWVAPDNPLSNALACWDLLLREVPMPTANVHVVPIGEAMAGGHPPAWAAARYAEELRSAALPLAASGFPILDVVLVGIGSDGHLFSVFPDSATWGNPAWAQAVPAPTHIAPRVERITLHPWMLDAARLAMVVTYGAAKAEIVGRIFGRRVDPRALPGQLARRSGVVWILDEAAALSLPPHLGRTSPA